MAGGVCRRPHARRFSLAWTGRGDPTPRKIPSTNQLKHSLQEDHSQVWRRCVAQGRHPEERRILGFGAQACQQAWRDQQRPRAAPPDELLLPVGLLAQLRSTSGCHSWSTHRRHSSGHAQGTWSYAQEAQACTRGGCHLSAGDGWFLALQHQVFEDMPVLRSCVHGRAARQ